MLQSQSILPLRAILDGKVDVSAPYCEPHGPYSILDGRSGFFLLTYDHIPPGSILLVRSLFAGGGKSVSSLQSFVFDEEIHSLWSHVALLDSNYRVWDIMPNQMVRNLSFADFIAGVDLLAVRTLKTPLPDVLVLQHHIRDQIRCSYPSFAQADVVAAFIRMMVRGDVVPIEFQQNELICSTFVDRILRLVTNAEILPDDRPPLVLPGHFARSTAFRDVPMADRISRIP